MKADNKEKQYDSKMRDLFYSVDFIDKGKSAWPEQNTYRDICYEDRLPGVKKKRAEYGRAHNYRAYFEYYGFNIHAQQKPLSFFQQHRNSYNT